MCFILQEKFTIFVFMFQDLRLQFAGAIPLTRQEKFSKSLIQLQQDKTQLEDELRQVWGSGVKYQHCIVKAQIPLIMKVLKIIGH